MTVPEDCGEVRRDLGVYVLGAISPAGRAIVDRHLASCPACREELAGLAGLPALMRRLPAEAAAQLRIDEAPGQGHSLPSPEALINRVAVARRKRAWRQAAAAAVLTAGAAAGWGLPLLHPPPSPRAVPAQPWSAVAAASNPANHVTATVRYTAEAWGTALEVHVSGIRAGTTCQIWATGHARQRVPAGAWTVARSAPRDWYPASASLPVTRLHGFEVTTAGRSLVTVPVG